MTKRRARRRPPPTTVLAFNAMSVSASSAKAAGIYRRALDTRPAIALGTECAGFNAAHAAGPDWDVIQYGFKTHGDYPAEARAALAGCTISIRDDVAEIIEGSEHIRRGSKATREGWRKTGQGVRARYIITARVKFHPGTKHQRIRTVAVGHAPPGRAPYARAAFMVRFAATRAATKAGDLNLRHHAVARLLGGHVRSVGLLHIVTAPWQRVGKAIPVQLGGDHLGVMVRLFPRPN